MGQADRRGTFEERKAEAIIRDKVATRASLDALNKITARERAGPTPEENKIRLRNKIALLSFMSYGKRLNLSPKELKRKIKRHNKKGT